MEGNQYHRRRRAKQTVEEDVELILMVEERPPEPEETGRHQKAWEAENGSGSSKTAVM